MQDPYLKSVLEAIASDALDGDGPHLISVDELRAAGALDVPAAWRKSLAVERDLFSGLFDDEESEREEGALTPIDAEDEPLSEDVSTDESR